MDCVILEESGLCDKEVGEGGLIKVVAGSVRTEVSKINLTSEGLRFKAAIISQSAQGGRQSINTEEG